MIAQLNESFVNTWLVLPQFETKTAIDAAFASEEARAIARAVQAAYTYPVDSLVLTPEAEVVAQLSVNELFEIMNFDEWAVRYGKMLDEGRRKSAVGGG